MNKRSEFGLPTHVVSELRKVFENKSSIKKATLYGSRAMGNFKPGSDIDLCLTAPELTLSDLLKTENEIDDLLLPYKVDLSFFHSIENPDLIEHIKVHGIPLWIRH